MNRVLRKRLFRDFRSNFMRYLALILLVVMGMYIVVSMVGAAETVISGTKEKSVENLVEDGQFTVFIPLTQQQEKELTDTGISLERMFSLDIRTEEQTVLRMMKNRQKINKIDLDAGNLAKIEHEVVLEKRYCEEHEISVGDKITLAGEDFTVVGVGSVPDYDKPCQSYSDVAVESSLFGLAFVTDEQYEEIKKGTTQRTEDYCYAYRLNDVMTDEELKQKIKDMEFFYEDVEDVYFQEMISEVTDRKKELQDGVGELKDGAGELQDGAGELVDGVVELKDGAKELNGGAGDLENGAKELTDGAVELRDGTIEVKDALTELDDNSGKLTDGSTQVREALAKIQSGLNSGESLSEEDLEKLSDASTKLKQGIHALNDGLAKVDDSISAYYQALSDAGLTDIHAFVEKHKQLIGELSISDTMRTLYHSYQENGEDGFQEKLEELANDGDSEAQELAGAIQSDSGAAEKYLKNAGRLIAAEALLTADVQYIEGSNLLISGVDAAFDAQSGELRQGAMTLQSGYDEFDGKIQELVKGLKTLSGSMGELKSGVNTLSSKYVELDDGIWEYTEAVYEIKDGSRELEDGANELHDGTIELHDGTVELTDGTTELLDGTAELSDGTTELKDGTDELADGTDELKTKTDDTIEEFFVIDLNNLMTFLKAEDNSRILAAADDVLINKQVGLVAGVIVMILFTYVISVFVIHQIQSEGSVIGALYALGVKKKTLLVHYITLPTWISFLGGLIGAVLGFSRFGAPEQMKDTYAYFSIPELSGIYPLYLILYSVVMPPVISAIVNYIVIRKRLSQTALSLIRNEQKAGRQSRIHLKDKSFIRSFQIRQLIREARTGVTICFGMVISLMILMLGVDCYVLCDHVRTEMQKDATYEYMYSLKYPEETVPEGGEGCYSESLSKTFRNFTLDVTILGIDEENPYFDAKAVKGKNKVVIAKALHEKYGLNVGDKLILSDNANEMDYVFTVEDICGYSSGLMVFMDIDSMRELFEQEEDYYNVVFSNKELPIDEGRVYSITTKADLYRASEVFVNMMMPMITMLISVAIIIFCVVMYLMMNVMVDRAGFGISLIKIFGFRTGEVKKLYLNGNRYLIALGAIIGIPVSKKLADSMYPGMIANISCGMNLKFPWYLYLVIFAGVMLVYSVINLCLVRKLSRISPVEVLKNRE